MFVYLEEIVLFNERIINITTKSMGGHLQIKVNIYRFWGVTLGYFTKALFFGARLTYSVSHSGWGYAVTVTYPVQTTTDYTSAKKKKKKKIGN